MIEGVSTGVAALQQMVGDHRAEVSRFVSSAGPVLDKVDTWVEDWQVNRDTYHTLSELTNILYLLALVILTLYSLIATITEGS